MISETRNGYHMGMCTCELYVYVNMRTYYVHVCVFNIYRTLVFFPGNDSFDYLSFIQLAIYRIPNEINDETLKLNAYVVAVS